MLVHFQNPTHINTKKGDISNVVILTGDPKRAKLAAEKFLKNVKVVSTVRSAVFLTGDYGNSRITIGTTGMGVPSAEIYSYELLYFYGVKIIIRAGTCGSKKLKLAPRQLVSVKEAIRLDSCIHCPLKNCYLKAQSNPKLLDLIHKTANKLKLNLIKVKAKTSDHFYELINTDPESLADVVEMESYIIFKLASYFNAMAASVLTVSDNLITEKELTSLERETTTLPMFKLILETIVQLNKNK